MRRARAGSRARARRVSRRRRPSCTRGTARRTTRSPSSAYRPTSRTPRRAPEDGPGRSTGDARRRRPRGDAQVAIVDSLPDPPELQQRQPEQHDEQQHRRRRLQSDVAANDRVLAVGQVRERRRRVLSGFGPPRRQQVDLAVRLEGPGREHDQHEQQRRAEHRQRDVPESSRVRSPRRSLPPRTARPECPAAQR